MKRFLLLLFIIYFGCANSQQENRKTSFDKVKISEDFFSFYEKFYNDTVFQNKRILRPLKGIIKTWYDDVIKEESWDNKEIRLTPKEKYLHVYKNLKTDLMINDTIVVEKFWIEQSGFFIEKVYIIQTGRWYLYSYDISNL